MIKVIAPMAGISDGNFLLKLIPYGFNVATLGGFNIDESSIDAGKKIISRGRKEFDLEMSNVFSFIKDESELIRENSDVLISCNVRSVNPENVIKVSELDSVDIVEINCHCRQKELTSIGCGQSMLKRSDLSDYIVSVVDNASSKVSVKIRANVNGVDTLSIAKLVDESGADFLHVDAMNPGVANADLDLIRRISGETDICLIGNNSINSLERAEDMVSAGADGVSLARACMNGKLDFDLSSL
jgi:TIM-barrel protein